MNIQERLIEQMIEYPYGTEDYILARAAGIPIDVANKALRDAQGSGLVMVIHKFTALDLWLLPSAWYLINDDSSIHYELHKRLRGRWYAPWRARKDGWEYTLTMWPEENKYEHAG